MNKLLLQRLVHLRYTIWNLAITQLKSRYAASVLGISWAVINPLLMMFVIDFVFVQVFKTPIEHFSFFVLAGIVPWMFFSNALSESASSILNRQAMLRQFNLPVVIFPVASVLAIFLNYLIGWLVLYPVFVFFKPSVLAVAWLFPLITFLFLFFVAGFCLVLSVLNIFFRDIEHLLNIVLMFWFWITPVFYSMKMVPEQFLVFYQLNPVMPFIVFYQKIVFEGVMPESGLFLQVVVTALGSFLFGLTVFMKLEPGLIKKM